MRSNVQRSVVERRSPHSPAPLTCDADSSLLASMVVQPRISCDGMSRGLRSREKSALLVNAVAISCLLSRRSKPVWSRCGVSGINRTSGYLGVKHARDLAACLSCPKAAQRLLASSAGIGFRDLPEALAFARGPASPDSITRHRGLPPTIRSTGPQ
jgi:hypothetical protein